MEKCQSSGPSSTLDLTTNLFLISDLYLVGVAPEVGKDLKGSLYNTYKYANFLALKDSSILQNFEIL